MDSNNLRLECLRLASMRLGLNGQDVDVVALAREYEQYATGEPTQAAVTTINDRGPSEPDAYTEGTFVPARGRGPYEPFTPAPPPNNIYADDP